LCAVKFDVVELIHFNYGEKERRMLESSNPGLVMQPAIGALDEGCHGGGTN
jgi:hypothetical protein